MRALAKRAALYVPPVQRLYQAVVQQTEQNRMLRNELLAAQEQRLLLQRQWMQATADAERAHAEQLARVRTDYAHCAANAEELRARLQESELRREQSDAHAQLVADLEPTIARPKTHDPEYARLLGGISVVSSELSSLRYLLCSTQSRDGDSQAIILLRTLYLELLAKAVSGSLHCDPSQARAGRIGHDSPAAAPAMGGRLRSVRALIERIQQNAVAGDLFAACVSQGSVGIYMRGVLAAYGILDRTIFVAGSFAGPPAPDAGHQPADAGARHDSQTNPAVALERLRVCFNSFGLLDKQVGLLPGMTSDAAAATPVERLALLLLGWGSNGSTVAALNALYAKVSPGGFIVIDDYVLDSCRKTVTDFRAAIGSTEPIQDIDGAAVFWQKAAPPQ